MFQCFIVTWDNGETERMSPWDFEPSDCNRMPEQVGGAVPVLPQERKGMVYRPKANEWPRCGRDTSCDRLMEGVSRIMELSIAEPFAAPVDLNAYPMYARIVAYPIDLTTIRTRLENRFYRRLDAVRFDVRFLEINAKKFNEPNSKIVQKAELLTKLLLQFINNQSCQDPIKLYQELLDSSAGNYHSSSAEEDYLGSTDAELNEAGPSFGSVKRKKTALSSRPQKRRAPGSAPLTSMTWKGQCQELLTSILNYEDSTPFRQPVDLAAYPDYANIIDTPMDLSTVRDRLQRNLYPSPIEFCKDMRLIFTNSRNYNTNKKSRIYSMTIRMSAYFEERMRQITSDWRSAVKYETKVRNNQYVSSRRHPAAVLDSSSDSQPSSSRASGQSSSQAGTSSSTTRAAVYTVLLWSPPSWEAGAFKCLVWKRPPRCTSRGQGDRMMNGKKVSMPIAGKLQSSEGSSSSETVSKVSRKRKATRFIFSSEGEDSHEEEQASSGECSEDEENEEHDGDDEENGDDDDDEDDDDANDDSPPERRRSTRRAARTNVIGSDDSSSSSCSGSESSSSQNALAPKKKRGNSSGESEMTTGSSEKSSTCLTDHDYGMPRRSSRKSRKTTSFSPETTVRSAGTAGGKMRVQTRNRGQQKVRYREEEDSDFREDSEDGLVLSVSSRGRLRKLSKHAARALVAQ
ncbi:hypothetical protein V5799_033391 [Amblyomma americanum]|uniref:Bromo domain-containing protein n=1 Tax=Amblyomma americanum TaxID=6943 RepID=A0AAQ4DNG0_AMBAM